MYIHIVLRQNNPKRPKYLGQEKVSETELSTESIINKNIKYIGRYNLSTHISSHYFLQLYVGLFVTDIVFVMGQIFIHFLQKCHISRISGSQTLFIHVGDNTCNVQLDIY